MPNKKGTGLLMVWVDVPQELEDEFNRWYNEEHIPELTAIPGVLNAARYEAVRSGPKAPGLLRTGKPRCARESRLDGPHPFRMGPTDGAAYHREEPDQPGLRNDSSGIPHR